MNKEADHSVAIDGTTYVATPADDTAPKDQDQTTLDRNKPTESAVCCTDGLWDAHSD